MKRKKEHEFSFIVILGREGRKESFNVSILSR